MSIAAQKYQGGAVGKTFAVGALFTAIAVIAIFVVGKPALFSYLVAFTYWAGVALSSLILLMIFHAFRAKWMVVLRRPLETMAMTIPFFLVLAVPILANLGDLYSWVNPEKAGIFSEHELHLLHNKHVYLNVDRSSCARSGTSLWPASWPGGCSPGRPSRTARGTPRSPSASATWAPEPCRF